MTDSLFTTEYIDLYLSGGLPPGQVRVFEAKMDQDPTFEEEVRRQLKVKGAAFKAGQTAWRQDKFRQLSDKNVRQPSWLQIQWPKLAACILLLIGIGWGGSSLFSPPQDIHLLIEPYQMMDAAPTSRGNSSSLLRRGYQAYNRQDYEAALVIWDSMRVELDVFTQQEIAYFRGLSYLGLDRTEEAKTMFESLKEGEYAVKAKWQLILILLREDQIDQAKMLLDALADHPSSLQDQVQELQKALRRY